MAIQDISEDEELFSIGRTDILCVENSDFGKTEVGRLILADLEDQWTPLILAMIFEFFRGDESPWKAYFDVLPADFNSLMFWTNDELDQLQASAVRQKIGKQEAHDMLTENVLLVVRRNQRALFPNAASVSDDDLLYLAHRMGSTIMAYAFDLENDPSQQVLDEEGYASEEEEELLPKGMIPMADMLNADADRNNARLFYERSRVTMRAIKPINAGEEVFNDYGQLPRSDLLRRYGYITPGYNQYDVVEIPRQLVIDAFRARALEIAPQSSHEGIVSLHCVRQDLTDDQLEQRVNHSLHISTTQVSDNLRSFNISTIMKFLMTATTFHAIPRKTSSLPSSWPLCGLWTSPPPISTPRKTRNLARHPLIRRRKILYAFWPYFAISFKLV